MRRETIFPYGIKEKYVRNRLFCFHHAGGSSFIFKNWVKYYKNIDVIPVDVPNRYKELGEQHFESLIDNVVKAILKISNGEKIFIYGHSLGALFAFETAYQIQERSDKYVEKIFVAGRHAPCEKNPLEFKCSEGERGLYERLVKDGEMDKKVLKSNTFKNEFLPLIFDDYRIGEEYHYQGERLKAKIITLSGSRDMEASYEIMKLWNKVTNIGIKQYEIEGKHFFPYGEKEKEVLEIIAQEIYRRKESI